jgi:ABC-2 type transport system permease protein
MVSFRAVMASPRAVHRRARLPRAVTDHRAGAAGRRRIGALPGLIALRSLGTCAVLPISPWAGLGVLAAWAAGALLAGGLMLRFRDA